MFKVMMNSGLVKKIILKALQKKIKSTLEYESVKLNEVEVASTNEGTVRFHIDGEINEDDLMKLIEKYI